MRIAWTVGAGLALLAGACNDGENPRAEATGGGGTGAVNEIAGAGGALEFIGDVTPRTYDADDPNIQYTGRVDFRDPKRPFFSAPAVYVTAKFTGNAVTVNYADQAGAYLNYYDLFVDDAQPILITPVNGGNASKVSGLPFGDHTVTFAKRTQASIGTTVFNGFEFAGQLLPSAAPSLSRKMEFIGDSITVGEGADRSAGTCTSDADGWHRITHQANLAFGPVLARSLGAAYQVTAVSGIGLVQNYDAKYDARPMPEVYDLMRVESKSSPLWPPERFVPDAIVIALGTNDFGAGATGRNPSMVALTAQDFANAYVDFIDELKGYYDREDHVTQFFCLQSPLLEVARAANLNAALDLVIAHYTEAGEASVHLLPTSKIAAKGCTGHPDVAQHATLAETIKPTVQAALGW